MKRSGLFALWVLGFLWSLPNTLVGLLFAIATLSKPYALRPCGMWAWVEPRWMPPGFGAGWQAFTPGGCVSVFRTVDLANDAKVVRHERRHLLQGFVRGPFFLPEYGFEFCECLCRDDGDGARAYRDIPLERDAYAYQEKPDAFG